MSNEALVESLTVMMDSPLKLYGRMCGSDSRLRPFRNQLIVAFGIDSARHVKLTRWLSHDQASRIGVEANVGGNSTVMCPFVE